MSVSNTIATDGLASVALEYPLTSVVVAVQWEYCAQNGFSRESGGTEGSTVLRRKVGGFIIEIATATAIHLGFERTSAT